MIEISWANKKTFDQDIMRLSSLKLAGFKSFADSSTLQFKANRTAVVDRMAVANPM